GLTGLLPNTTYHYRIFGVQATRSTYTYGGDMTFTTSPVETIPQINGPFSALEITTRSANLRAASVTAGSQAATVSFQYGLTTSYGMVASFVVGPLAANTTYPNPTVSLTGLLPSTSYHYRCKAISSNGTSYGSDGVFTTASIPIVTTGSATNIGDISAFLGGTIVAGGGPCSPSIQWGKTTAYGSSIPFQANITASGPVPVGWDAGPLEPATTYHFRLVAYDGQNTIYGGDGSFTTTAGETLPNINITRVSYAGFNIFDHQRPYVSPNSAILVASFNSGAAPATLAFEYGASTLYGSEVVNAEVVPALTGADYMLCAIRNLTPSTTYHFRSRVSSSLGTVYSEDFTFVTLELPEVLTTKAALVSDNYAVLRGSVAPHLWNYDPVFEFGTSPAFGSTPQIRCPPMWMATDRHCRQAGQKKSPPAQPGLFPIPPITIA
ncbi:MAG: hypothetical protein ABI600_14060, partial [Luteolibacter sp.]